jgi:CheY-like chemotaxis protein
MTDKITRKILVVDDEKIVRDFLSRLLTLEDMEVKVAEAGAQAIAMVREEKFDIVFIDARMPQMDGLETLKELKNISPGSKYVMMTGYSMDTLLEKTGNEKIEAFIKKPFEINEIVGILEDCAQEKTSEEIRTILVIDSEPVTLDLFKKLLKNYNVITVTSGKEALEHLGQREFDVVFLGMGLGDMSSTQLCAKIREAKPNLEIIVIMGDVEKKEGAEKDSLYKQIKRVPL